MLLIYPASQSRFKMVKNAASPSVGRHSFVEVSGPLKLGHHGSVNEKSEKIFYEVAKKSYCGQQSAK